MSSLSSVSSSANTSYAAQLAQTSAFERSLYNLGTAVQNGDMTSAGSILTALIQANPQYATTSGASGTSTSSSSTQSQDPINQDFQNLANAISSNQPDAAKTAWTQLKNDLAKAGITNISSGTNLAAQAVAQNEVTMQQDLLSALFGGNTSSNGSSNLSTLLGGSTDSTDSNSSSLASLLGRSTDSSSSSSGTDSVAAALNNWLTYQADGTASAPAGSSSTTDGLDTVA
jgi:hypothetical protein